MRKGIHKYLFFSLLCVMSVSLCNTYPDVSDESIDESSESDSSTDSDEYFDEENEYKAHDEGKMIMLDVKNDGYTKRIFVTKHNVVDILHDSENGKALDEYVKKNGLDELRRILIGYFLKVFRNHDEAKLQELLNCAVAKKTRCYAVAYYFLFGLYPGVTIDIPFLISEFDNILGVNKNPNEEWIQKLMKERILEMTKVTEQIPVSESNNIKKKKTRKFYNLELVKGHPELFLVDSDDEYLALSLHKLVEEGCNDNFFKNLSVEQFESLIKKIENGAEKLDFDISSSIKHIRKIWLEAHPYYSLVTSITKYGESPLSTFVSCVTFMSVGVALSDDRASQTKKMISAGVLGTLWFLNVYVPSKVLKLRKVMDNNWKTAPSKIAGTGTRLSIIDYKR